MKKFIGFLLVLILLFCLYTWLALTWSYSAGERAGYVQKFSKKGWVCKTWEGELSQGISGAQIFSFSVLDSDAKVIEDLKGLQGRYVKLTYVERYKTFSWWGETRYFITSVHAETSPFKIQ